MATLFSEVAPLRHSSRQIVRELGMLAPAFGREGLGSGAWHILMEIEAWGLVSQVAIAETLRIEKSTLSRLVATLERKGLVELRVDPEDKRRKLLSLTEAGREAVRELHCDCNERVNGALEILSQAERSEVLRGLNLYAQALDRSRKLREFKIRPIRVADNASVANIIRTVMTNFGLNRPGSAMHDAEVDAMAQTYGRPGSAYFVAEKAGKIMAGGGIAPLEGGPADTCELRKMYSRPEARGFGVGQRLLRACLEAAREGGYRRCYIETIAEMTDARRLYERNGFKQVCSAEGKTGHFACDTWYAREL